MLKRIRNRVRPMRWFRNLNVSRKLRLGFGMILFLMAVLGIFLCVSSNRQRCNLTLASNWLPSVEALAKIRFDTTTLKRWELNLLLADRKDVDSRKKKMQVLQGILATDFTVYEPLISSDQERKLYEDYRASLAKAVSAQNQVIKLAERGKHKEAVALSQGEGRLATDAALQKIGEDIELNVNGGKTSAYSAATAYAASRYWVIALLIAAILSGIALLLVITRSIATPVQKTMAVLESLAARDLTQNLDVDSTDELGMMAVALNHTIEVLRGTLGTITLSAEQLASASEEISAGAGLAAEESRVQSDQSLQLATAMQEMSATVLEISSNSQKASRRVASCRPSGAQRRQGSGRNAFHHAGRRRFDR